MIGERCKLCGEPITSALGCDSCRIESEEEYREPFEWECDEDYSDEMAEDDLERELEESEEEYGFSDW